MNNDISLAFALFFSVVPSVLLYFTVRYIADRLGYLDAIRRMAESAQSGEENE